VGGSITTFRPRHSQKKSGGVDRLKFAFDQKTNQEGKREERTVFGLGGGGGDDLRKREER